MVATFIVRLMTADDVLLSWAEVQAESRPQGRPRSTPFHPIIATQFFIERDGIATKVTVHWADLDLVRSSALLESMAVQVGQRVNFTWAEPVWLVPGSGSDIPLPAVTVRSSVAIGVPVGAMGVKPT